MKLPVFTVASTVAPAERLRDLGERLLPRQDKQLVERGATLELRSQTGSIEIDTSRGGTWAADNALLWRFDPGSAHKRQLVAPAEAQKLGLELLRSHGLLPEMQAPFRLKEPRVSGAITAFSPKKDAPRQVTQEDTTMLVEIEVDASDYGVRGGLPVVGGGGRFSVVLGEAGRPLAARGVWRPAVGKPTVHEVIAQAKADESFRELTTRVKVTEYSSKLAYYAAPAFTGQELLYPVYVYSAVADFDGKRVPLRNLLIPATEVAPRPFSSPPAQPERARNARPVIRPLPADLQLAAGKTLPPGIGINRRRLKKKGLKLSDYFLQDPISGSLTLKAGLGHVQIKELANLLGLYSAGASWIGLSGGLAGSQKNAQGFVDELSASGWNIRFNWGDGAAWESDWRVNDDTWVDAVDFVFYTGHANSDGWVLSAPDDAFLQFSETAGARDLWGANNLEWAVVAACGPLQDEAVGSGGNVLERWRDAFDGLHMLMGYAQVTYDNEEEGKRLAQYAKAGNTIMQSWFRTGQEIQPGGIWVGAYYVGNASGSTGNDHLWGLGSVGPDIANPTWRACSWVPC